MDIKSSNLMMNVDPSDVSKEPLIVKFIDFGLMTTNEEKTFKGTDQYMHPKVLNATHAANSFEHDIWSLILTIIEIETDF